MITLNQILTDVNANIDLEAALPIGDELTLRTNYANQAIRYASDKAQLSEFDQEYVTAITTLTSLALPSNFREFKTNPRLLDGTTWIEYPEILPEDKYNHSSDEEYCYVLGNPMSGYSLNINSPVANATLSIIYQRYPSGMATLSDVCELSDPGFVTTKIESYVLYSRSDERFPTAEARAEAKLQNMIGKDAKMPGGGVRTVRSTFKNPLG